jgi:hypothetical protein
MICRKCGKQIVTLAEYHTKYCCRTCFNKYQKDYHAGLIPGRCKGNCLTCHHKHCVLPITKYEKAINAKIGSIRT